MDNKQVFQKHQKKVKFHVDSKYSISEIIGEGAYGVVCSAVDTTNGQRVAIKKICGVFDVPSITKRTLRELKILKHFKHDNVISIKEILRPPSNVNEFSDVYVVMDLMGSDLHHIIHSKQELSAEHIRYFLYQLLRGLKYIHSANIIHRDLKPSNLLINKDCELKIGDFGMARSLSASLSEKKRVMTEYVATRWYRAPELMLSVHQFTKAIDVWSVGCIFAEMLGREALFPGSNYLNQLQLILSVVGVPSVEFMATITSERVRSYISRLPQRSPVSFATLYKDASSEAIELLSQLLILDPGKRVSVEDALKKPFVEKYHDLDDEPTCRKFDCDIESIPLERDKLKVHILQEIQYYHSKRAKPNLAPIQTDLLKSSYKLPTITTSTPTPVVRFNDVPQTVTVNANSELKTESKKRKQKTHAPNQMTKKKPQQSETQPKQTAGELSTQDKELLQRWADMQKERKPFIHPIRKHMVDLLQMKAESVVPTSETVKGQAIVDRVSTTSKMTTPLQFTNFVPQQKNGGVALVAEQTVKMPSTVIISSVATSNINTAPTIKTSTSRNVLPANKAPQTILVPVGSVPMFQLQCAFGGTAPIVIIPNLTTPKVSAPVHIAPKPTQVTTVNIPYQVRAGSNTIIAPSSSKHILPNTCVTMNTRAGTRTGIDLVKSDSENMLKIINNKNKASNPPGSKIVIRIDKPPSTVPSSLSKIEMNTSTTVVSTTHCSIPSSSIHFDVASQEEKSFSANSSCTNLTFDSDEKKSASLSGDLLSSRMLHSAGSFLSELTISSAELDSAQSSAENIPVPQVSPEECAQVIAEVKKLDDEDKKIVDMIEELEERREYSGTGNYDKHMKVNSSRTGLVCTTGSNTKNTVPITLDTQPCTTVPSSHTDNWSIVKNMLVNSIRAKQLKKAQQEEHNSSSVPESFTHVSISGVTPTSSTLSTSMSSMQRSPVQQTSNTSIITHEGYAISSTSNNSSQTKQGLHSTRFPPSNSLLTNQTRSMNTTSTSSMVRPARYSPTFTSTESLTSGQGQFSVIVTSTIRTNLDQFTTDTSSSNSSLQGNPDNYPIKVSSKNQFSRSLDRVSPSKISTLAVSQYLTASSPLSCNTTVSVIQQNPFQYMAHKPQSNQRPYTTKTAPITKLSEFDSIPISNNSLEIGFGELAHSSLGHSLDFPVPDATPSSSILQNSYTNSIQSKNPVSNVSNPSSNTSPLNSLCLPTSISTSVVTAMQKHDVDYVSRHSKSRFSNKNVTVTDHNLLNLPQPVDNLSIVNLISNHGDASTNRTIVSSHFPLFVDSIVTTRSSPSLKIEDKMFKDVPLIKVEDVPSEKINDFKGEDSIDKNISVKTESVKVSKKECRGLGTTSSPTSSDAIMKGSKEEDKETLLSHCTFGGNLTPLLKCSISDVDDAFLTTFVNTPKTPKSGAAGYGLGMDFEDLFAGTSIDLLNPRYSWTQSESAPPLSASLLNDWLGMNEIDPADFEDLQRELESTSYSLLDSA